MQSLGLAERRVYEVDPLVCTRCGGEMRVISVILDPKVIRKILDHIRNSRSESLKGCGWV